ncbi:TMV resistance protein N-like isoform X2 [Pistacia vera]|uniref:TMV resistance protein N-like isoform X2 n=1 Tax=Pistacia vera TaxID=55513 RepID=UPI0012639A0B|nr:TMV resistance protein N-like isoform X2 [Pistacia vera]
MSIQRVSSFGSSTSSSWKYDVFISFRGADTRRNFTSHLYTALIRKGISVFKDDKELKKGKPIPSELLDAIEKSRISIVVFSKDYASSPWCLRELARIVQCKNTLGQKVIPIFYGLVPSVEREHMENFDKAFVKHEEDFRDNIEEVETWKRALTDVIKLRGEDSNDRDESELIKAVVEEISCELSGQLPFINFKKLLAGVNSCLEKVQIQANTIKVQWRESTMAPPLMFPFFFFFVRCFRITPNKLHCVPIGAFPL